MIGFHIVRNEKSPGTRGKGGFAEMIRESHEKTGCHAFQLFVKSPLSLRMVSLEDVKRLRDAEECAMYVKKNGIFLVSHASYLFNSATKNEKWNASILSACNELLYAEKLGAIGSVFHVGKYLKQIPAVGIQHMREFIREVICEIKKLGSKAIYILETCASAGTELLSDMGEMGTFFHSFTAHERTHLKICIDTCHVFASGYSLTTHEEAVDFIGVVKDTIQWENVAVVHLNDSVKGCGCGVDKHMSLCKGCIGGKSDAGFRAFCRFCADEGIPMILETPADAIEDDMKRVKGWLK